MTDEGLEAEKKYDVDAGTALPDLAAIPGVAGVGDPHDAELEAVYFDTEDLVLASRRFHLVARRAVRHSHQRIQLAILDDRLNDLDLAGVIDGDNLVRRISELHHRIGTGQHRRIFRQFHPHGHRSHGLVVVRLHAREALYRGHFRLQMLHAGRGLRLRE